VGRATLVPHNVPFTLIGAGLLWFGWFGFNAGSALAANGLAGSAFLATNTAAAAAMTMWMVLDLLRTKRTTAVGMATGAVIGLVAITPAAGFVTPLAAIAIGALGATASFFAMQLRARLSAKLDDALDVFACHGVAGMVGALLTGVFATKTINPAGADGLLYGNPGQLGVQALAVFATIAFCGGVTAAIVVALKVTVGLRVPLADELSGLDWSEHGEEAYHGGGPLDDISGGTDLLAGSVVIPDRGPTPGKVEKLSPSPA
jgi:Amt family ammonium transporter